jgi:hypothetical protein
MSEIRVDTITEKTSGSGTTVSNLKNPNQPFRNKIINGDMQVSQRGTSFSLTTSAIFTTDRFQLNVGAESAGRLTATQTADGPGVFGLTKCLKLDCTTADTSIAAGEVLQLQTKIEGQHLQEFHKGTSGAKKMTVSFYVKGDQAAKYTLNLFDADNTRMNGQTFDVTTSWTRVTLVYNADTTGAFDNDANNSLQMIFVLHGGTTYSSGTFAENTWASYANGLQIGDSTTSFFDSTDREFFITGLQLEVGDQATDFEHLPHDVQLQRCQRYYQQIPHTAATTWQAYPLWGVNANVMSTRLQLPVVMRAAPTGAFVGTRNTDFKAYYNGGYQTLTAESVADTTDDAVRFDMNSSGAFAANAAGGLYINTTDGRITLTAEL